MGGPFKNSINAPNDFMQKFGPGIKKNKGTESWGAGMPNEQNNADMAVKG